MQHSVLDIQFDIFWMECRSHNVLGGTLHGSQSAMQSIRTNQTMLEKNESGNEKTLCEMKHRSNVAMLEMGKK